MGLLNILLGGLVVRIALTWTVSTFARGEATSDGDTATDVTATALEQPAGVVLVVGVLSRLVVWAALTHDPEKAAGWDAACRYIGQQPLGGAPVGIGVELGLYGVFCLGRARYADAS